MQDDGKEEDDDLRWVNAHLPEVVPDAAAPRVRETRRALGLSQRAVAQRAGLSLGVYGCFERGTERLGREGLARVVRVLDREAALRAGGISNLTIRWEPPAVSDEEAARIGREILDLLWPLLTSRWQIVDEATPQ